MAQIDKIKKAITWIRKTLEITQSDTTTPGSIVGEIRPTLDALGWERYQEQTALTNFTTAIDIVTSPAVPADTMRLVTAVSLEHNELLVAHTLMVDYVNALTGTNVGLATPVLVAPSALAVRVGFLDHPFLMSPRDTLRGSVTPIMGATFQLRLRWSFIDLPLGEYIPSL